ncbi:MAG: hypothetical protein Q9220_004127 [cf. Caloplaca sp. 1 TL-2023]
MASDDDFFVVRRFGKLAARVILFMQNRLVNLEKIIEEEDAQCMKDDRSNGTFDLDECPRRRNAMEGAAFQLESYQYDIEERIDKFVTGITIILGLAMLITPLWLLQYLYSEQRDLKMRLEIITCFLIGFTVLLSIVTVARPVEVIAATAAYAAMLMVFMQLNVSVNA